MASTYVKVSITYGGTASDDRKLKVSSDDAAPNFLEDKIDSANTILTLSTDDPGGDETLILTIDETEINHDNLTNYEADEHIPLDDTTTTTSNLWSASKIQALLDAQDDASEITYTPDESTDWNTSPTRVDLGLDELAQRVTSDEADLAAHLADASDAHDASAVSVVPEGTITSMTVQLALEELDDDIQAHLADLTDAHAASAITNTPAGTISATTVQDAIDELDTEKYIAADFNSDFSTQLATKDTDDLTEGSGNLYFTEARAYIESGDIKNTDFAFSNNVSSAVNITGLAFSNGSVRSFKAMISVIRSGDSLYEQFEIRAIRKGSSWDYSVESVGDESGIELSVTTSGQVQYTSSNLTSGGTITFRAEVTSA